MKTGLLFLGASLALASIGVAAGGYAWWRSTRPLHEIRVQLAHTATAHENEVMVLEPLERVVAQTDGLRSIRSEATPSGVTLSAFFPDAVSPEVTLEHVRAYLRSAQTRDQLPADAVPAFARAILPTQQYFLRSKEPVGLATTMGVLAMTVCGARAPERITVRIDLPKLAAVGLDLADVHRTLDPIQERGPTADLTELGMTLLRGSPTPVALRDVATVSTVPGRSDCDVFSLDGGPTAFHFLDVLKEHEAPVLQQAKALGQTMLSEDGSLRIEFRFEESVTHEQRMRHMLGLLPTLRDVEGLSLYGAVLRRGVGEVVFATTKTSKRASIDALRTIVGRTPGLTWSGARGPLSKGIHRLHVTVTDGLVGDLPKIEATAADIRQRVEATPGVGARLVDIPGSLPHTEITIVPGKLAPDDAAWVSRIIAGDDDDAAVLVEVPDWQTGARFGRVLLSAIVTVQRNLETARFEHVGIERAIELVWETTDLSVLGRVKRTLEGVPLVTTTLD